MHETLQSEAEAAAGSKNRQAASFAGHNKQSDLSVLAAMLHMSAH